MLGARKACSNDCHHLLDPFLDRFCGCGNVVLGYPGARGIVEAARPALSDHIGCWHPAIPGQLAHFQHPGCIGNERCRPGHPALDALAPPGDVWQVRIPRTVPGLPTGRYHAGLPEITAIV
jgi:hypothetical protein